MKKLQTLIEYGLFDAKVPRYTSYPPANRFLPDSGANFAPGWIAAIPDGAQISVYIHIPFCRRLCWFCACRTQGTKSLDPVDAYVTTLITEITEFAAKLPHGVQMSRLHLGGGTPTLLSDAQMEKLLGALYARIPPSDDMEFSVEIDPTEVTHSLLALLGEWGMNRASIGVQDFNPEVQKAIGREQSLAQTADVINYLRAIGVGSLNLDLLYGLPHQTGHSLQATLDDVIGLRPDRIALYGYAHVPHMSKRQIMIPAASLPNTQERYYLSEMARVNFTRYGYEPIGIDHFALPTDSLSRASRSGTLRRNFQGYTDDPCAHLIGFGASAISSFPQGYSQNAVATAAYIGRIRENGTAAQKGIALSADDYVIANMISDLMCYGRVDLRRARYDGPLARRLSGTISREFPAAVTFADDVLRIQPDYQSLARIVCARLEGANIAGSQSHSVAI